jgi:hypothetical protein
MLMHWPYHEILGNDFSHSKLYDEFAKARAGRFEERSAFDGVERLHVTARSKPFLSRSTNRPAMSLPRRKRAASCRTDGA